MNDWSVVCLKLWWMDVGILLLPDWVEKKSKKLWRLLVMKRKNAWVFLINTLQQNQNLCLCVDWKEIEREIQT